MSPTVPFPKRRENLVGFDTVWNQEGYELLRIHVTLPYGAGTLRFHPAEIAHLFPPQRFFCTFTPEGGLAVSRGSHEGILESIVTALKPGEWSNVRLENFAFAGADVFLFPEDFA